MLFNSIVFLAGFLPLTLLGVFLLARWQPRGVVAWLLLASLIFYGWWNPAWLPLMLSSIALNLGAGRLIAARVDACRDHVSRRLLIGAIALNLLVLAHFKYGAFLVGNLNALGADWAVPSTELPLGISFFTFTQIAFLVDVYQRRAHDVDPLRYGLFVTYYPHLIAGPILHHRDMMSQFERPATLRFDASRLADALVLFILGLFKKVVLADAFGNYASPAFDAAAASPDVVLTLFEGWGAALAYTLQIYFDFSGYSDMAIALAAMVGIRLPMNFDAPYRARNIAEFWRRWHMTLSRFLRDYLYIPLGGNRHGAARQQLNLMLTMLLGGLWHGAGWNFVIWGGLHGCYLMTFHASERAIGRLQAIGGATQQPLDALQAVLRVLAWPATFVAVVIAWVFFRATNLGAAGAVLRGMAGLCGAVLPEQILTFLPPLRHVADGVGKVPYLGDGTVMGCVELGLMLAAGLALVRWAPTLPQLSNRVRYALVVPCGALALQRVLYGAASPFLYFQF
ncbi:MAG: MBOAT family protein [Leptothrix sp. (in: b-proteobacteria)]